MAYGISSFPTTFMIDKEGNVFGYASGQLSEDMMRSIIRQTVKGKENREVLQKKFHCYGLVIFLC